MVPSETLQRLMASSLTLVFWMAFSSAKMPVIAQTDTECPVVDFSEPRSVDLEVPAEGLPGPDEPLTFLSASRPTFVDNIPAEDSQPSLLRVFRQRFDDVRLVTTVDIGIGAATPAAAHPAGNRAVVAVKDEAKPNVGTGLLKVVETSGVRHELAVGPGPESVRVSLDGRFAVVANRAASPTFPDLPSYRKLEGISETYSEVAADLASGLPAVLGFGNLEVLLRELGFEAAEDLLEATVFGDLTAELETLAARYGFLDDGGNGDLDAFARTRGFDGAASLLAAVLDPFATDNVLGKLLEVGLVAERPDEDIPGSVTIVHLPPEGSPPEVVAEVSGEVIFERFFVDETDRAFNANSVEPTSVASRQHIRRRHFAAREC